jgi:hypothetical protein
MKNWYERFNDAGFTLFNESGEATCVHIARDHANNVDTTDKWIDVISHTNEFEKIIIELFPRITHPKYTQDTEYNRYICWHTAHNDISVHRGKGNHGTKYMIYCTKIKINTEKGKVRYDYKVTGVTKLS